MKNIFLPLFLFLFSLPAAYNQGTLLLGLPFQADRGFDMRLLSDKSFLTTGLRGNNAVLYKTGCGANLLAQIEKSYNPGPARFFDATELPDGSVVAAGSASIVVAGDTLERVILLKTDANLVEITASAFTVINKAARAKSVLVAQNGDLLVLGEVTGVGFDFLDMFLLRVDAVSLQPVGDPALFNNGVDIAEEMIRTADGNLLLAGSSFFGNIFNPDAEIDNRLQVLKTTENGSLLWQYTYKDTFPAQYGLALAGGVEQNPSTGNFMLSANTYGGTPDWQQDAFLALLDNNGNLLDTALLQAPGKQSIFCMTGYIDLPGLYLAAGHSDNPVLGAPNLFIVQGAEINNTIFQANYSNDPASAFSVSDVIEIGQNRIAAIVAIPDNLQNTAQTDIIVVTPQLTDIDILYQNCALAAAFSAEDPVYQWYFNEQPIAGATNGVYFPKQSGIYRVQITDAFGCSGFSDTLTVTLVSAGFEINANGLSVEFSNTSSGATSYTWDFGDGSPLLSGVANPVHNYAAGGPYTVTLIASSPCGTDTITQTLGLVGSGEPALLESCRLFPNPNDGVFSVEITGAPWAELDLALFDPFGRLIERQQATFTSGKLRHDFGHSGLAPGVYQLRIGAGYETRNLKVMILR
jgi:hypothetical protein